MSRISGYCQQAGQVEQQVALNMPKDFIRLYTIYMSGHVSSLHVLLCGYDLDTECRGRTHRATFFQIGFSLD
jgi:hypothetical protein